MNAGTFGCLSKAARPPKIETFTTSGTWYKDPAGVLFKVIAVGAGGGGGGGRAAATSLNSGGTGGMPGEYIEKIFTSKQLPDSVVVTVGVGGTSGNRGGVVTFDGFVKALGGKNGSTGAAITSNVPSSLIPSAGVLNGKGTHNNPLLCTETCAPAGVFYFDSYAVGQGAGFGPGSGGTGGAATHGAWPAHRMNVIGEGLPSGAGGEGCWARSEYMANGGAIGTFTSKAGGAGAANAYNRGGGGGAGGYAGSRSMSHGFSTDGNGTIDGVSPVNLVNGGTGGAGGFPGGGGGGGGAAKASYVYNGSMGNDLHFPELGIFVGSAGGSGGVNSSIASDIDGANYGAGGAGCNGGSRGGNGVIVIIYNGGTKGAVLTTGISIKIITDGTAITAHLIGAGGASNGNILKGGGGGGGAYGKKTFAYTSNTDINYVIGVGAYNSSGTNTTLTYSGNTYTAKGGTQGSSGVGGAGGNTTGSNCDVAYAGGNGGNIGPGSSTSLGGGGGAAGPNGAGGNGGNGVATGNYCGGGGGNGGGTNGGDATTSTPGNGGNNSSGVGGAVLLGTYGFGVPYNGGGAGGALGIASDPATAGNGGKGGDGLLEVTTYYE